MKKSVAIFCALSAACVSGKILLADTGIPLADTSTYSQSFDASGLGLSLPAGWVVSAAGQGASSVYDDGLSQVAHSASTGSPSTGGSYYWISSGSERAVGFMTASGGFASPNSVMARFDNTSSGIVTQLDLSFDYERYRINSTAAQVNFFTSTDGSTWTAQTAGDSGAFSTATSSYRFNPPVSSLSKSVSLAGLSIPAGGSIYLRWSFSMGDATGGNSQALGLDNFTLKPTIAGAGLVWSPIAGPAVWSAAPANSNWNDGTGAAAFVNGMPVQFTEAGRANGANVTIDAAGVSPGTITVANTGGVYSFGGGAISGAASLNKTGAGELILFSPATFTGGTTISGGALVMPGLPPVAASGASVVLNAGGTLTIAPSASSHGLTCVAGAAFFSLGGGKIDLNNNDMFVSGGASLAVAMNQAMPAPRPIVIGDKNPQTTTGIMTGVTWLSLHPTQPTFGGQTVAADSLLFRYGYAGDANMDDRIDIDDYLMIDAGYAAGASDYAHGDFDHNGVIDAADYALIDYNASNLAGALAAGEIAEHRAEFGLAYDDAFAALQGVPEPGSLLILAAGVLTIYPRLRNSRHRERNALIIKRV